MAIKQKTIVAIIILGSLVLLLAALVVGPVFGQIKKESENFIIQRNKLFQNELKIQNLQNFQKNSRQYEQNLKKSKNLFVDASNLLELIEFLEKGAGDSGLAIEIAPPVLPKMELRLTLIGKFADFSKFLEKLENNDYLIAADNLIVRKDVESKTGIIADLTITVLTK